MSRQNECRARGDWRNERFAQMLETGRGADVYFLVGRADEKKQLIYAHKNILSAISDVFEAQFLRFDEITGTKEGSEEKPIEVSDISPGAFHALLRFVYANDLISEVNRQNILEVYYAGKKYMITALVNACRQLLLNDQQDILDVDNVLSVLKHAQFHEDEFLIGYCWSFVDNNVDAVLESDEFLELDSNDLCELFSRDTLASDEFFLFVKLNHWAIHKCEENGLEETPENKRKAIGEAIYQIRFPLITQQQFTEYFVPIGLLTEADIIAMYVHYSRNNCCDAGKANKIQNVTAEQVEYCASGIGNTELQFPNRFNSQPRASQFCINIVRKS